MEISSITLSFSRPPLALPFCSSYSTFFQGTTLLCTTSKSRDDALVLGKSRCRTQRTRKGLTCNALFGLGVPELVVIAGVAALVFGPKKLPEVGKSIGKTVKSFQQVGTFHLGLFWLPLNDRKFLTLHCVLCYCGKRNYDQVSW